MHSMDSGQEAGEGLACAHLRHQHYWIGGAPLFHSQKCGSGKVRDPDLPVPSSALPLPQVPGAQELWMAVGQP